MKGNRALMQRIADCAESVALGEKRLVVRIKRDAAAPHIELNDEGGAWVSAWFYVTAAEIATATAQAVALAAETEVRRQRERYRAAAAPSR